jgi:PhzF family phenazine biosynthesis protein
VSVAIAQVDAYTNRRFAGNPAAVCILPEGQFPGGAAAFRSSDGEAPAWMAAIARETNLPATAFVLPDGDAFHLRWFTATTELELCGHGTLATAHALCETGRASGTIRLLTRAGELLARQCGEWIELNFPSTAPEPAPAPAGLADALGVVPRFVGRSRLDYLVEVDDESTVRSLRPDLAALRGVEARGVIVTSAAGSAGCDFVSRFFAPATGIDEDSVTGSAHCALGPYWAAKLGRTSFTAHQLSKRGGVVRVAVEGDRVRLAGQAVTITRGELIGPVAKTA